MPVRVLLADHHILVRAAIRGLLEEHRIAVVGESSGGAEAAALAAHTHPSVVLIDAALPRLGGVEAARRVHHSAPDARIVLLGTTADDRSVLEAFRNGVCGFVQTTDTVEDLVQAIRNVSQGGIYVGPHAARGVLECLHGRRPHVELLSPRERQMLDLVAEGKTTKAAGAALGISMKTADYYRTRLMKKLNIHSVAGLVRYELGQPLGAAGCGTGVSRRATRVKA